MLHFWLHSCHRQFLWTSTYCRTKIDFSRHSWMMDVPHIVEWHRLDSTLLSIHLTSFWIKMYATLLKLPLGYNCTWWIEIWLIEKLFVSTKSHAAAALTWQQIFQYQSESNVLWMPKAFLVCRTDNMSIDRRTPYDWNFFPLWKFSSYSNFSFLCLPFSTFALLFAYILDNNT